MAGLQNIWDEIGISEEQKEERTQVVLKHLQTLLHEMVIEEQELKKTLLENVETCTNDLKKLSEELGMECPTVIILVLVIKSLMNIIQIFGNFIFLKIKINNV